MNERFKGVVHPKWKWPHDLLPLKPPYVQGCFFIRHIHNYTEYNQQWNVSQVHSMDSAIICYINKILYINIGMKKMK